jgi:type II secretory pathway predicted ATPase ExeA
MYEKFFGLKTSPFSLLPDPAYLFQSGKHQLALSTLEYAINNQLSLSVVSGEVGAGKTTLIRQLLNNLGDTVTVGLISNTHRAFGNLMQWVALAYGLPFKGKDKVELYQDFVDFLCGEYAAGRRTLLIVDEAQNLDPENLEELRLLTNVNADDHMVMQLLLVGQPELHDLLKRHELRQLAQRISVFAKLEALDERETAAYIRHRMEVAGGDPYIFHKNALRLIYWNSGGIPRVINTLCELALVYAYADGKREIDAMLIADIARDRIDTGLYGNQVYDMRSLRTLGAGKRRGSKAGAAPPAAAAGAPVSAEGVATDSEQDDAQDLDLVVDGGERPDLPVSTDELERRRRSRT